MFRFSELELHGWDYWPAVKVPLDAGVVVLSGPNGSGKTTMLDAIRQILNGPRLSQKRHVAHYLRRPNQPVLLRAVVSNQADERGRRPFERQQVLTDEATLACALVPDSGVPEKRFLILPGRVPAAELQKRLLDGKDWLAPEAYRRALEHAGISRSLMHILALEQGRADDLANYSPRELFRWIMEARGSQQVLDRYNDARKTYEQSSEEVYQQSRRVGQLEAELSGLEREVRRLDEYLDLQQKAVKADEIYWATLYQFALQEHREIGAKLPELRTKAANLLTAGERLKLEQQGLEERLRSARANAREAERYRDEVGKERDAALASRIELETQIKRFVEFRARLEMIKAEDVDSLRESLKTGRRALFGQESEVEVCKGKLSVLDSSITKLEAGKPVFPPKVDAVLQELEAAGIQARLTADSVEVSKEGWADAVESALGPLRFALVVAAKDEKRAIQIASKHNYPAPLTTEGTVEGAAVGPVTLSKGGPTWLREWAQERKFGAALSGSEQPAVERSGRRRDRFGVWCDVALDHVLGKAGVERQLAALRIERKQTAERLKAAEGQAAVAAKVVAELESRLRLQEERLSIEKELVTAAEAERRLEEARVSFEESRKEYSSAVQKATDCALYAQKIENQLKVKTEEAERAQRELGGLREKIAADEQRQKELEPKLNDLSNVVTGNLRQQAEQGELTGTPPQAEAGADACKAALKRFKEEGPIPDESVRAQQQSQIKTIQDLKAHIESRQKEADALRNELDNCRGDYLEVIRRVLADYGRRARSLAEGAQAKLEVEMPHLENDDRSIDEAGIVVRIGFDGKSPIPVGDSSLSGGQKVIAGLIVLMSMAETDKQSFFILDEPFAHLSLDRVDEVGQFLRNSGSQFLITVPTTLDKGQLDPASLLIVLRKKDSKEKAAPRPIIARA